MRYLISRNFRKPDNGIMGFIINKYLIKMNVSHEKLACQLSEINPAHKVLEVGFGPGIGLKEAYNKVSRGTGSIHGIDISQRSFNVASKRLKQELDTGKIKLHLGSVTDIPYPDCSFDRIFHSNCFYYWPDMDEAVRELHRVIKPECVMVTVLPHERLKLVNRYGFMQCGNMDADRYITSLQSNGFENMEVRSIPFEKESLTAIVARATE